MVTYIFPILEKEMPDLNMLKVVGSLSIEVNEFCRTPLVTIESETMRLSIVGSKFRVTTI